MSHVWFILDNLIRNSKTTNYSKLALRINR